MYAIPSIQGYSNPRKTKGGPLWKSAGKFADAIRFSGPVSSASLSEIESGPSACADEIQRMVMDDGSAGAIAFLDCTNILLGEELVSA